MASAILKKLGGMPSRYKQPMIDDVIRILGESQRPLFVDEADYLSQGMLDVLRDIHDIAHVPVVIICMEDQRNGLIGRQRFRRRITNEIRLLPLDKDDAGNVVRKICEAELSEDLFDHLFKLSAGNIGLLRNGLRKIEQMVTTNGWDWATPVTRKQWGDRPLIIGGESVR